MRRGARRSLSARLRTSAVCPMSGELGAFSTRHAILAVGSGPSQSGECKAPSSLSAAVVLGHGLPCVVPRYRHAASSPGQALATSPTQGQAGKPPWPLHPLLSSHARSPPKLLALQRTATCDPGGTKWTRVYRLRNDHTGQVLSKEQPCMVLVPGNLLGSSP